MYKDYFKMLGPNLSGLEDAFKRLPELNATLLAKEINEFGFARYQIADGRELPPVVESGIAEFKFPTRVGVYNVDVLGKTGRNIVVASIDYGASDSQFGRLVHVHPIYPSLKSTQILGYTLQKSEAVAPNQV